MMDTLRIEAKEDSPAVLLNRTDEIFEISGRSLPEDTVAFYTPVIEWVTQYGKAPNVTTEFTFKMDYFNTSSSKLILDLICILNQVTGAKVLWYYAEDDEEIIEAGKEFAEQVEVTFEFRTC